MNAVVLNLLTLTLAMIGAAAHAGDLAPVPYKVPAALPDKAEVISPSAVHLDGWLGQRVLVNAQNRLAKVDLGPLLAGFQKKPGTHPWIGEHIGKWMHAATLAWVYTGDARLKEKLDFAAHALAAAQEPDGYLGTYTPDERFGLYPGADWDVWVHKYNLIGLLTYYQFTGNTEALETCRKMADLLIATFPARKSILAAGTHVGMAATSVLEPIVLLYRFTGEPRYLEFARYLVKSWDEPGGPAIIASLMREGAVHRTANAKAYEMLSNLVGLCELARATGDASLLKPVLAAWSDIVDKRLYVTGSASQREHFRADHELPNSVSAHVAETCVTTTWIQLNLQLLRLTGEARFGHELEKTLHNHLTAAQRPDGAQWCYFTSLEGRKPYGPGINCCVSSGPRGLALAPLSAYLKSGSPGAEVVLVSTFETSSATLPFAGGPVTLRLRSEFPQKGRATLGVQAATPARFALRFRTPAWASPLRLTVNGQDLPTASSEGWTILEPRLWRDGDRVDLVYSLGASVITGHHGNAGRQALRWGPFVLAYDEAANPAGPFAMTLGLAPLAEPPFTRLDGADLRFQVPIVTRRQSQPQPAVFVPFAEAGASGKAFRVWLPAAGSSLAANLSLLAEGEEGRSRPGNREGSILDGDPESVVVTFDGRKDSLDWFSVTLPSPVTVRRVVFVHGLNFHDGGWFDASESKPWIEGRRGPNQPWERIGVFSDYPATTATNPGNLKPGARFTVTLQNPLALTELRVVGRPACGDNPAQAFSSCAELEAFTD